MIYISYKTTEIKQYSKKIKLIYEELNEFLCCDELSIIKNRIDTVEDEKTILKKINYEFEQIYYEPIVGEYIKKEVDLPEFWDRLFSESNKITFKLCQENKLPSSFKNTLILLNETESLGPWQSIETLIALKNNFCIKWISVSALLSIINKTNKKIQRWSKKGKKLASLKRETFLKLLIKYSRNVSA